MADADVLLSLWIVNVVWGLIKFSTDVFQEEPFLKTAIGREIPSSTKPTSKVV